jgi:hypothetical protein
MRSSIHPIVTRPIVTRPIVTRPVVLRPILIHPVVIHPIEVAFESIQVSRPEAAELRQPAIQLLKWFRFQPVETALRVHRGFHEASLSQHAQVLRHGRLRHTKLTLDLSHRMW